MYATLSDMVARFGAQQLVRLSRQEDREATTPDPVKVETSLKDATAIIDSYLRGIYATPIAVPPAEIVRAACVLARYDLAQGENVDPSDEMAKSRKEVIDWLTAISKETLTLEIPLLVVSDSMPQSGARSSDRQSVMSYDSLRGF